MTDFLQDQAALYALGLLDPEEARAIEQHMTSNPALAALVRDFQDTLAETTRALPADTPPAAVRARVLDQIRQRQSLPPAAPLIPSSRPPWGRLGWGLAAAFSIASVWLFTERVRLAHQLAVASASESAALSLSRSLQASLDSTESRVSSLSSELKSLQQRDSLARMQIATLQSTLAEYQKGVAVVVWDSQKERGILKLEKMPPIPPDKDYQLWVVDPAKPKTVDAGIVRVDADGFARVEFKPVTDVSQAAKFALSIERKGGVPENQGPVILVGP
jgi:anti-sigma-K factor RskA